MSDQVTTPAANASAAPPDAAGSPPPESTVSSPPADAGAAPPAADATEAPASDVSPADQAADTPPQIVESAPPAAATAPVRNPLLDAIIAKVQQAFRDCEDKQRQAIDLRRETRRIRAGLDAITDAGERAQASDHADALLRQACVIEERLPDLMQGVGELMVAQIKEISERPD